MSGPLRAPAALIRAALAGQVHSTLTIKWPECPSPENRDALKGVIHFNA